MMNEELRNKCDRSETHKCCILGQPHAVKLSLYQEFIANHSNTELKLHIVFAKEHTERVPSGLTDDIKLELKLRENLLEGTEFNSVDEYVDSKCRTKMSTDNFGRGSIKPLPLRAIYLLLKKVKKYEDKSEEDTTEEDNEKKNPSNLYIPTKDVKVPKYYSVEDKNKYDMVNQPKHYMFNIDGHDVQAVDILKGTLTPEEFRGWLKGSYLTYLLRADRKNGLEDLKKANTFLNWQIQFDNGEELTLPGKNEKGE